MRWYQRVWRTWWDGRVELLVLDLVLTGGMLFFDLWGTRSAQNQSAYPVAIAALTAAMLMRRRYPLVLLVVGLVGMYFGLTLLPITVGMYSVAARFGVHLVTLGIGVVAVVATGLDMTFGDGEFDLVPFTIQLGLFFLAPTLGGLWMHQRAAVLQLLRERAEEAERNRTLLAEQAVSAERRRIAREMHDVVAHRVTAIALQAGALSVRAPDAQTEQSAETIRQVSVTALDELRGILKVLREDGGDEEPERRAGTGMLASVRELVEDVVAGGGQVSLTLPDPMPEVPIPIGRAAYRVVQEALTNAGKHAPGAPVVVVVTAEEDELVVRVTNRRTATGAAVPGSGYGLVGMRERVDLADGALTVGPLGEQFQVLARFPMEAM